ncbi:flavin reductase (DIM6/NTAB) family NADH-FMN oxidoreductase RutF [Aeromicrobium sp. SORGH_AS981]|nr:flavin reductase (DIM6/NTAB) family NADH-FMN oxidoreductase RutF [Aeromicrobium sp. SORGH_AS_0981]
MDAASSIDLECARGPIVERVDTRDAARRPDTDDDRPAASSTDRDGRAELLKAAFRRHATGVAVVTALGPDGPVGLTASSVASVSAHPPALSFSVLTSSRTAQVVAAADVLDVHLLPADLVDVADAYGRSAGERFTPAQGWVVDEHGTTLPGAVASLRCVPITTVPVGEAVVVVAEVRDVRLGPVGEPLVYHDRTYRTVGRQV